MALYFPKVFNVAVTSEHMHLVTLSYLYITFSENCFLLQFDSSQHALFFLGNISQNNLPVPKSYLLSHSLEKSLIKCHYYYYFLILKRNFRTLNLHGVNNISGF